MGCYYYSSLCSRDQNNHFNRYIIIDFDLAIVCSEHYMSNGLQMRSTYVTGCILVWSSSSLAPLPFSKKLSLSISDSFLSSSFSMLSSSGFSDHSFGASPGQSFGILSMHFLWILNLQSLHCKPCLKRPLRSFLQCWQTVGSLYEWTTNVCGTRIRSANSFSTHTGRPDCTELVVELDEE